MNTVHLIDCMDFMADKPDNYYDLAICDPPYNVGASDGKFGGQKNKPSIISNKLNAKHYTNYNKTPNAEYFQALFRISKNQIIWGSNYYPQHLYHSGAIVWDKLTTGPLSDCEIAYQSFNKLVIKYTHAWSGFRKGKDKSQRIHPNQKPLGLYKWLLKNYAKPGQTIFDSHVGSGSIRIACRDLGFDFEGCEIDSDYWQAQEDRYNNHIQQADLFGKDEMQKLIYGHKGGDTYENNGKI